MAGYTSVADTILDKYNFLPYFTPHEETEQQHSTSKYEFWDLGGGESMVSLANPGAGMNILVKFSP